VNKEQKQQSKKNKNKEIKMGIVELIIAGIFILGTIAAVVLASFAIAAVAKWIFRKLTEKGSEEKAGILVGQEDILTEVVSELEKRGRTEIAQKLKDSIEGKNGKVMIWNDEKGSVEGVDVIEAEDMSIDEVNGKILRFGTENGKQVIREY
jgi:hypothetical protein